MTCGHDDYLTITYSDVTVPAAATYTFTTRTSDGATTLTGIDTQPQIVVEAPTRVWSVNDPSTLEGNSGTKNDSPSRFTTRVTRATPEPCTSITPREAARPPAGLLARSESTTSPRPGRRMSTGITIRRRTTRQSTSPSAATRSVESNETFDLTLSSPSDNTTILDGTGVGTITNDDDWLDQTIGFDPAPIGVTVGAIGVSVSATATSLLPVAYSSTTESICSVDPSSGALTLLAIGTCTIAADQAGGNPYNPAPQVTQNVDVAATPAPSLGLVAAAVEPDFAAAGDVLHFNFTLTNTGNVVLDGPFSVTSAKVDPVTCPVTATLALGASIVCTGTHTVTAADVTAGSVLVTASGQGLVGSEVPVVTETSAVTVPKAQPAATPHAHSWPDGSVRDGRCEPGRHSAADQHHWRLLGQRFDAALRAADLPRLRGPRPAGGSGTAPDGAPVAPTSGRQGRPR